MRIKFNWKNINLLRFFNLQKIENRAIYIFAVAIFFVINLLISSFSLRIDLSQGQAYTLSPATKKILKSLDDIVNIKFYISSDLPTKLIPLKTDATDLLNEYKKEGRGKIIIKILDPKKDEKALSEVKELGIPELQFSQLEQDKYALTNVYFGMSIIFGDKTEIIPQATELENLEYNLTSAIYKVSRKEAVRIGIVGYNQSLNQQEDVISTLTKVLQQQFNIDYVDVSSQSAQKEIDPKIRTIAVFDTNKKKYDEQEIKTIKNYIQKGGKAIFFVDGVTVLDNLSTEEVSHNLYDLIEGFGIKINKNLVLSTSAELVNFGNDMVQFFTPYPFWLKTNSFNNKLSFFSNINQLMFPWSSSLNLENKNGFGVQALVKSSNKSWEQKGEVGFILNPQNIPNPQPKDFKEFILTALAKNKSGGEVVVFPTSRFVLDRFLSKTSSNLEFVFNLINDMASEVALSGIRSRAVFFYPLPDLSENQKDIFRYLNILLLPSLMALYGGYRLMKRK